MMDYAKLRSLGAMIHRIEPGPWHKVTLTVLVHDGRDEVTRHLVDGLKEGHPELEVEVQTSSGEYLSHIAVLEVGANRYTFARDFREVFIGQINHYSCRITAGANGLLVWHRDYPGVVRDVTAILAECKINISKLNVSREQRGQNALLVLLTDEEIPPEAVARIGKLPRVTRVISLR